MLKHLYISQYALIDELELSLEDGFSVITGETGAGKSIIMGALALVMGARADSKSVREGAQKCVVEASFSMHNAQLLTPSALIADARAVRSYRLGDNIGDVQLFIARGSKTFGSTLNSQLSTIFEEYGLDWDEECVIRREVTAAGKSRAFVNDTPVTLQQMRAIASLLIDIHSQHENLLLNDSNFQLKIVDIIAQSGAEREAYGKVYGDWRATTAKLAEVREMAEKWASERDYAQFQFDQLNDANLIETEQAELEAELEVLNHTEEIKGDLSEASGRLDDEQYGVVMQLRASNSLRPHGVYSPWNSPGKNTGVDSHSLLQGIILIQGSNPGLPHCGQILYQLSHQGSPRILEWVAYPFSSRSS